MSDKDLFFVIPTYRLHDVGETVELYDEHFWRNGHSVKMIVFDDSSPVAQEKYYPLLEQTRTHNDLYYVGPKEKEQFTAHLNRRLNDRKLRRGNVADDAIVKRAQTYRSGTNDIDAIDYVDMFLEDEDQASLDDLNERYVLVNFRPVVTNINWRMDCGVAGYDNTLGLPPFFPTRLRFEDYVYRLWIQQEGIVAAHVDAARRTPRATTCGTRRPPRSSTRRSPTSSSGRSRGRSRGSMT